MLKQISRRGMFCCFVAVLGSCLVACTSSASDSSATSIEPGPDTTVSTSAPSQNSGRFLDSGLPTEPGPLASFDYEDPAALAADADVVFVATISETRARTFTLAPTVEDNPSMFTEYDSVVFAIEEVLSGDVAPGDSFVVSTPTVIVRAGDARLLDTTLNQLIADALQRSEPGRYLVFATQRPDLEVFQFTSNGGFVEVNDDGSIGEGARGSVFGFGSNGTHGYTIDSVRNAVAVSEQPVAVQPPPRPDRDDLVASCNSVEFSSIPPDLNEFPELEPDASAALAELIADNSDEQSRGWLNSYAWTTASRTDDVLVLFGQRVEFDQLEFFDMRFELRDGVWESTTLGQCTIGVSAEGFSSASVALDLESVPQAGATAVDLLITEQRCASGTAPTDREIITFVDETAESVFINVLVEPVDGEATCPSNPAHPITIQLEDPLGTRTIIDASAFPYTPATVTLDN